MKSHGIEALVVGTAQDGGIPQLGCDCPNCHAAWVDMSQQRWAASLAIVNHASRQFWLIDATPDIREQMHLLFSTYPGYHLAGVLLTHAHTGHYLGLAHLGRESWNQYEVPVFGTKRMVAFLKTSQPWKQLVELGNIAPFVIEPRRPLQLATELSVTPLLVPHRDELSDTVAFTLHGPNRKLIYCPDIDRWEGKILQAIKQADTALLDGTFYSANELPGRNLSEIPHPPIVDAMKIFDGYDTEIRFIHLNHSNPLLGDETLIRHTHDLGFEIASEDERHML